MRQIKKLLKPFLLIGVFSTLIAGLYSFGLFEYCKWEVWKEIHADIKEFVALNIGLSILLGVLLYFVAIMTFLPGLLLFDLIVGYVYPQWIGMLVIMTSATVGAVTIMSACRFGFKSFIAKEDNKLIQKVQSGFAANETLYLLFLRVMPFFPFAFVSAALSTLPVSYKKVAWTTFIGMAPVAFVLTGVGNSLGDLLRLDHQPGFSEIVSPSMIMMISLLSILSLFPILLKRFKRTS